MAATGIFGIQIACSRPRGPGQRQDLVVPGVLRKIILLIPLIYILPHSSPTSFAVFLAEPVADIQAVCTTAVMFSIQFRKAWRPWRPETGIDFSRLHR